MTTNLWKMTREQHKEVYIRLNFSDYSEVFTAHELLSDGSFTVDELQACCEMDGKEWTPNRDRHEDVVSLQIVDYELIEDADDYDSDEDEEEYNRSWRNEIAREAGAMYGMQAYHDHMGYDFDAGGDDGNCSYCGGNGWTCC